MSNYMKSVWLGISTAASMLVGNLYPREHAKA
jgi:hypothetical protein